MVNANVLPESKEAILHSVKRWLIILLAISGISTSTNAQDLATIPYRVLLEMADVDLKEVASVSGETMSLTTTSTNPQVPTSAIKIDLVAGKTRRPLTIADDGRFELPISQELVDSNAILITNQPKGSMRLKLGVRLGDVELGAKVVGDSIEFKYDELFIAESIRQQKADKAQKHSLLPGTITMPLTTSFSFMYSGNDANHKIVLRSSEGDKVQEKKANGQYQIPLVPEKRGKNILVLLTPATGWDCEPNFGDPIKTSLAEPIDPPKSPASR